MRPVWNGSISFGMVNIPVSVYSATRSEKLSFNLLHKKDFGRIGYQKVCKVCGAELENDDIIKGYEYEKGEYVPLTDEDFDKVSVESTKTINISDFVDQDEIDPMFFETPYYLVPGKNADHAYVLLREALKKSNKFAVAKVAFREREHLAVIKATGRALMMETMHFADEITDATELKLPEKDVKVGEREIKVAVQVVEAMTGHFNPEEYKDTYREALLELIEKKIKGEHIKSTKRKAAPTTKVVDIMDKLKQSLKQVESKRRTARPKSAAKRKAAA